MYDKSVKEVMNSLKTSYKGLTKEQVQKRIQKHGLNEIKAKATVSPLKIFLSQFKSFLVALLFIAVLISLAINHHLDAIVIAVILILNAVFGFVQEYKAEKSIQALKKLTSPQAVVLRNNKQQKIDAKFLVPGDIILLETGDKIPADARIIESINLQTQESSLTGESLPIKKQTEPIKQNTPIADRFNIVFSGTIITTGRGKAIVTNTGMSTEIGKIASMIEKEKETLSPLQKKLKKLGEFLGLATIIICIAVFFVGILSGIDKITMLITSISLAVAAIPEGLPAIVTISLALGTQKMIKKNALIRKLPSVETLGSTTVICTDKTGTLTLNQMTVRKIFTNNQIITVTGRGYDQKGEFFHKKGKIDKQEIKTLLQIGALCNNSNISEDKVIGDPTEASLIVSAAKAGIKKNIIEKKYKRLGELQFTSERKRMSTYHNIDGKKTVYCKGAPEIILKLCNKIDINGKIRKLTIEEKQKILKTNEEFAKHALRVLGFAYKQSDRFDEKELIFVGLQGMIDPPRKEIKNAIAKCRKAGIKVIMITGDFKTTAQAVANEVGLHGRAVDGTEIDKIHNLPEHVEDIAIYARVDPYHKVKILKALKQKGEIVAMTGDGVNDAPALKKADIGVSMGIAGTDVAKESSDMILTDDNFASIVNAVEEGRGIYDNIRKFVQYLLSSNLGEILTIFIALIFAPFFANYLPLIALQILWINLATDGLPALALGVEPAEYNIMQKPPRNPKENIMTKSRVFRIFFIGILMMLGTLGIFKFYDPGKNLIYAQTMAFTTLVMFQLFHAITLKSEHHSLFKTGLGSNKKLIWAILISLGLQIAVVYLPFLQKAFGTTSINLIDWGYAVLVSASVLVVRELMKICSKVKSKSKVGVMLP